MLKHQLQGVHSWAAKEWLGLDLGGQKDIGTVHCSSSNAPAAFCVSWQRLEISCRTYTRSRN